MKVDSIASGKKIRVLMELRTALQGFAGIPQETRLTFSAFQDLASLDTTGLIVLGGRQLRKAVDPERNFSDTLVHSKINQLSRFVISVSKNTRRNRFQKWIDTLRKAASLIELRAVVGLGLPLKLYDFDATYFPDFIWRSFFSKTLPISDYEKIIRSRYATMSRPWDEMHDLGRRGSGGSRYPKLSTAGYDFFLSQTPWPGRVSPETQLVVRYHDAIPIFLPHTIPDVIRHQATHYRALRANAKAAVFACVSEATRRDLLIMFPQLESRSTVIHNIVSHQYFEEQTPRGRVTEAIRNSIDRSTEPKFLTARERNHFYERHLVPERFRYLLVVSSIEPRKNHLRALAAWEQLRWSAGPDLRLVFVGLPGWDYDPIVNAMKSWQERGLLFHASGVSAGDLRVLYQGAEMTMCPSIAEGFDYSGIEAMRCGSPVIASDIPVHREVYGEAAEYFNPYSTGSAVQAMERVVSEGGGDRRTALVDSGRRQGLKYVQDAITPQWEAFFSNLARQRSVRSDS